MKLKRHQKILIKVVGLFILGFAPFCIYVLNMSILQMMLGLMDFCCLTLVALLLNRHMRKRLNPKVYPDNDWYREHLERNYDYLLLGGGNTKTPIITDTKVIDLSLPNQTIKWDFVVLKQYFSILKPHGCAVFSIDSSKLWKGWCDVQDVRPYYLCIRPYVFSLNRYVQFYLKVARRLPLVLIRFSDLFTVSRHTQTLCDDKERTLLLLNEIVKFCKLRDIVPCIMFVDNANCEIAQMVSTLGFRVVKLLD